MESATRTSEGIALRKAAADYGEHINDLILDNTDEAGKRRWKRLERAAVRYTRAKDALKKEKEQK
jgi:hypothetical protein